MRIFFTITFLIISVAWTIISVHIMRDAFRIKESQGIFENLVLFIKFFGAALINILILILVNTFPIKVLMIMYISCIVDYFLFVFLLNLKEGEIYCLKPFLIFLIILVLIIKFV